VREIANNLTEEPFRWTAEALLALQEARGCACARSARRSPGQRARGRASHARARRCSPQSMEDFMVKLFEDCNLCAIHAKRVTISAHPAPRTAPRAVCCAAPRWQC
jgi:histone H3